MVHKILTLAFALREIRSLNRHVFSVEDLELLDGSLLKLEQLRKDVENAKCLTLIKEDFSRIVQDLNLLFATDNAIKDALDSI